MNSRTGVKSLREMLIENRSLLDKMRIRIRPEAREVKLQFIDGLCSLRTNDGVAAQKKMNQRQPARVVPRTVKRTIYKSCKQT